MANKKSNLSEDERRERRRLSSKKWNAANKDRVRAAQKRWEERNPHHQRERHLRETYGLTVPQFEALLSEQSDRCAVCLTADPMGWAGQWHVDHCHTTQKVRGILCSKCNMGLGLFKDNPEVLVAAANYVKGRTDGRSIA